MSTTLQIGETAPKFTLPDQAGKEHSLSDYQGKWVIVYFYPKDDTPGCTVEACAMRDSYEKFVERNAVILGVSADSEKSHAKFAKKFTLNFPLLADTEHIVAEEYGVWGDKLLFGKSFLGINRMSFLIDPLGNIAKIYPEVNPEIHSQEVLEDINHLSKV